MTHKLLLADDSITIQRVIELTFSGEDVDVVSVGDGEQAIERMRSERPDIVLADIAMPKRSGYDVAAYVRSQPELAHVPVLLLAGAFEPVDQVRAEAVQADGVLVKPFEPQQVVARVRELLRRGTSARRVLSTGVVEETGPAPEPAAAEPTPAPPIEVQAPAAPTEPTAPVAVPAPTNEPEAAPSPGASEPLVNLPPEPAPVETSEDEGPVASVPPSRPSAAAGAAVDEFFGRLGSAVASLGSTRPSQPNVPPPPAEDPWTYGEVPTVSALLDQPASEWAEPGAATDTFAPDPKSAPADAFAVDNVMDDRRAAPARAMRQEPARNVIAEAFHALLAAEQGRPRPVDPISAPFTSHAPPPAATLVLSDELVDRVTQRVLERLVPHAAREMVASIVSDVAERLVREELARVKARADTRS